MGDLPRCDANLLRSDQDNFDKLRVETPQISLPYCPTSAKSALEVKIAAVVGKEASSHPKIKSKAGKFKDEHVQLNSWPLEDQRQQGFEGIQNEAMYVHCIQNDNTRNPVGFKLPPAPTLVHCCVFAKFEFAWLEVDIIYSVQRCFG